MMFVLSKRNTMNKTISTIILFLGQLAAVEATEIKGTITDDNGEGLPGVNVFIKDTYDGATTNAMGEFRFETFEEGDQTLVARFIGYKTHESQVNLNQTVSLNITLKEEVTKLSGVTITAGSFEASDEKKAVILKPLDVAMTAGATADIPGALNTLPGTTTNGETGRLFVRGGTANETQAFIDGVLVHNMYMATPNNVPSRSRFSPFLFKGTFFSTGGYSAEYGQALSSVLSLNSTDLPEKTQTDLSLMTVGLDAAHTQKWENGSVYGQVQYTDLDPYQGLIDQEYEWKDGFTSANGTFMFRQKVNNSDMLKVYGNYDHSAFAVTMPNINNPAGDDIDLVNNNFYLNTSYRKAIGDASALYTGVSYGKTNEDMKYNDILIDDEINGFHAKSYFTTDISQVSLKVGAELIRSEKIEDVILEDDSNPVSSFTNNLYAGFAEADYYISNSLTLRAGIRYAHYSIFNEGALSPRVSMALKTGENAQFSWAYGQFHQLPTADLMIRSDKMSYERADHYLLNYQTIQNGRTFRAEVYYKDYKDQVKFDPADQFNPFAYDNSGDGYAAGLDVFFRDSKTIRNGDFWISYSLIDTKRNFRNYPYEATPEFAARHNLSIVYKHWISDLRTQIGAAWSFNSGRPYNDPNQDVFNGSKTDYYSNLSFNFAYLWKQNVILYASATNLTGRNNVFGYEFENDPGMDGIYDSRAIGQPAPRFYFVGLFITLTRDKQANQLNNL